MPGIFTPPGPLYGGKPQPPQMPALNLLNSPVLRSIIMGLGADLATGRQGAGALAVPSMLERREEERQRNTTREWLAKQPWAQEHLGALDAGLISGRDLYNQHLKGMEPQKREFTEDATGRKRYVDTQELVFPDVQVPQGMAPEKAFEQEQKLRKEYTAYEPVEVYNKVRDSYERVRSSAIRAQTDSTGASDMAMIFNYMKMLDPGSTVREGEFATAAASGGYGAYIQNLVNQITSGKLLTPQQRAEFVRTAEALYGETAQNLSDANTYYGGVTGQYGIDPNRVLIQPEQYEPLDLKVGETRNIGGRKIRRVR